MDTLEKIVYLGIPLITVIVCSVAAVLIFNELYLVDSLSDDLTKKLEQQGFTVTQIEVNSPTYAIKFDTIQKFIESAKDNNITEIFTTGRSLYYFNNDLTIGYKVFFGSSEKLNDYL